VVDQKGGSRLTVEEDSQLPNPFCSDDRPTPSTSLTGNGNTPMGSGPNHPIGFQGGAFSDNRPMDISAAKPSTPGIGRSPLQPNSLRRPAGDRPIHFQPGTYS